MPQNIYEYKNTRNKALVFYLCSWSGGRIGIIGYGNIMSQGSSVYPHKTTLELMVDHNPADYNGKYLVFRDSGEIRLIDESRVVGIDKGENYPEVPIRPVLERMLKFDSLKILNPKAWDLSSDLFDAKIGLGEEEIRLTANEVQLARGILTELDGIKHVANIPGFSLLLTGLVLLSYFRYRFRNAK